MISPTNITELNSAGSKQLPSIELGDFDSLQQFSNLTKLNLAENQLASLQLPLTLGALQGLLLSNNRLKDLKIPSNDASLIDPVNLSESTKAASH